jgi:hypothetical protein
MWPYKVGVHEALKKKGCAFQGDESKCKLEHHLLLAMQFWKFFLITAYISIIALEEMLLLLPQKLILRLTKIICVKYSPVFDIGNE